MAQKKLFLIFVILCIAIVIEILALRSINRSKPTEIMQKSSLLYKKLDVEYGKKKRDIELEYNQKKYLASGKTAYDRIFNSKLSTLESLIQELASEAFPTEWKVEIKVEEFTHFILLLQVPYETATIPFELLETKLKEFLPLLSFLNLNLAVFDRYHRCYLFFDESDIDSLQDGLVSMAQRKRLEERGKNFTKFNSITVLCKKINEQLLVPLDIVTENNYESCFALLDTGASITVLSKEIIQKTGDEILDRMQTRSFETANGLIVCPIVNRELHLANYRKTIEIAVSMNDDNLNLLGMNYFKGLQYLIDSQNSCIYLWSD